MPKTLLLPALLAALLLPTGCATAPTANELAVIKTIASTSAYVGAGVDLRDNPAHRPQYVLAQAALAEMIAHDNYTAAALHAALAQLPALRGADGALIDGGLTLYVLASNLFIDLNSAPRLQAAVIGISAGLTEALARPTGTATRALAPDLPTQCTVPAR